MENKPKKSKALIITIIVLILLLIFGYLIYKNRDVFGVKTSASIAKIFSPLISSTNSKNLSKIDENSQRTSAQAGEDIKGGDNVSVSGSNSNNIPIIMKSGSGGTVFGFASQDIANGDIGEVIINSGASNTFWDSFSGFLGGILGGNNGGTTPPPATNSCTNGADNPPDCNTIGGACMNGTTNPPTCTTGGTGGTPDLIAGTVTPTNTIINKPTTLSSIITNIGSGSTGSSFTSFFTITNVSTGKSATASVVIPSLDVNVGNVATTSYTFNATGDYSIRVCADKSSSSDAGTIAESNEDNNCGPGTTLTVTNSLPTEGDTCTNGADNPTLCTTKNGACVNGATNPPDCANTTCLSPKITDTATLKCIDPSQCLPPKVINGNKCEETVNACLLIDKNPLTFTDDEKAQLAELLRKFYLIAPNLKTEDDINIAYSTITQYQNFSEQLSTLINQCYLGTKDPAYIAAGGPTLRFGNPWYKYNDNAFRGSYIDTKNSDPTKNFDCKYVSGWFSGTGTDGKDCDTYNRNITKTGIYDISPALCTGSLNLRHLSTTSTWLNHSELYNATNNATGGDLKSKQDLVYTTGLNNKCVWNPGANIADMEKISNVW